VRHRWALPFVALLVVGAVGSAFVATQPSGAAETPPDDQLVEPTGTGSVVWPYTSRSRSAEGRTLAVNVVVVGEPAAVRRALTDRSDANWTAVDGDADVGESALGLENRTDPNRTDPNRTAEGERDVGGSPWRPARGASRYTYVSAQRGGGGRWVESSYQLGTGTYLGRRVHVRAYPGPGGDWTALQAHTEYWDWFRLRHTVTGVAPGARFVERDLRGEPFVERISRVYHGQGGGGSDGWLTVVEFASAALVLGVAAPLARRRWTLADVALPASMAALVLGVRTAGIAAEGLLPATNPKLFVAALYPVLAAGPPAVASVLARERPASRAALLAAGGFGAGLVLDVGSVGVVTVPVRLVLHRTALVGALGVFTLGVARADRRLAVGGAAAWVLLLAGSVAGVV
jgi:hypothetical protein